VPIAEPVLENFWRAEAPRPEISCGLGERWGRGPIRAEAACKIVRCAMEGYAGSKRLDGDFWLTDYHGFGGSHG
jgi:hypothetical protein